MRALLILAILAVTAVIVEASEMQFVSNGRSDYAILTPENATPSEALAAQELAKYIEAMSGAKLPVKAGGKCPAKALVVCEDRHLADTIGVARLSKPLVSGEAYSINSDGNGRVFIVGGRGRAVLFAVYDLLERLGCRFLAPNLSHYAGSHEVIPKKDSLSVALGAGIVERRGLSIRKLYVEEGRSHDAESLAQMVEWMPKARFNLLVVPTNYQGGDRVKWDNWREKIAPLMRERDLTIEVGGHGYQNFLNAEMDGGKVFELHSDWFGMDEAGARRREKSRVFCTSNAAAVRFVTGNVLAYLKARPEIRVFAFWPPDGAKWCECPKCKALGSPSDRQAILLAHVKDALAKAGLNARLETIAYSATVTPPEREKLIPDLLLDFCPIGQCFEVQIDDPASKTNAKYVEDLRGLRKGFAGDISVYSYYRKYAWRSLPNIIPHYMQRDLQFYLTIPIQGISTYAEPGDWFAYELNHYTLGRLAWNPKANVDKVVKEFADARYGAAAPEAIAVYAALEASVGKVCSLPGTDVKPAAETAAAEAALSTALADLRTAAAKADDPAVKRNLNRLALSAEYALRDMEIRRLQAEKAERSRIEERVNDLHAFLTAHKDEGVFLLHSRLEPARLREVYSLGK